MTPTKTSVMPKLSAVASTAPTRNSLITATKAVATSSTVNERDRDQPWGPEGLVAAGPVATGIEMLVRLEGEDQAQGIRHHQDDGDFKAQLLLVRVWLSFDDLVKHGGHEQADDAERQHRRAQIRRRLVEFLDRESESAAERAQSEHQQDVADDRSGDRRFDDVRESSIERDDSDDELGRVAERRVEQPAHAFAHLFCQVLRRFSH